MKTYRAGMDIGSTTVKLVVLDENDQIIYGQYRRHHAEIQGTLAQLLREAQERLGPCTLRPQVTGSGSINLGKAMNIGFVQEVVAVAAALQKVAPQTDVAIELGGEDAKIIYFTGGLEERMNGVCAGGTGSFIDQMASLLQTDAAGLNREAAAFRQIYPIAARCGVFAKTDIQPLINEGATKADLAASIFQAVVNQTVSGLACGKPIRGKVAFLGGPLHFLPELKKAFVRTLKLTPETTVDPENSHLFAAMGAALESGNAPAVEISELVSRLERGVTMDFELKRLEPLFRNEGEFDAFRRRHSQARVKRGELASYKGPCYLGIDAGSTTTKVALIGSEGQLLYEYVRNGVERKFPYCDYEYIPVSDWNYAYAGTSLEVERRAVSDVLFSSQEPPVVIKAKVRKIDWGLEDGYETVCAKVPEERTPVSEAQEILLYPYGCAKLRMTEIPLLSE